MIGDGFESDSESGSLTHIPAGPGRGRGHHRDRDWLASVTVIPGSGPGPARGAGCGARGAGRGARDQVVPPGPRFEIQFEAATITVQSSMIWFN